MNRYLLCVQDILAQEDHPLSKYYFRKQALSRADFFTLKIWTQSDHWLKSYGQKVNFLLTKSEVYGHNFWASGQMILKFLVRKNLQDW